MDVSKLFLGKQEFTEKEPENPCEYGRRTWDMMNGNTLKQNKNLRIMCMGLMGALAVATHHWQRIPGHPEYCGALYHRGGQHYGSYTESRGYLRDELYSRKTGD